jgi:SAM-dependent methyltransferase
MRNKQLVPYRERVIRAAEGRVLEIGVGSGMNLPFYRPPVREVLALEPAPRLITMARSASREISMPVSFLEASAEAIPLEEHSVDTIVTTWTLGSIPQAATALADMRRVLRRRRQAPVRRARLGTRRGRASVARSADAGLAVYQRGLSPQSSDPLDDRSGGIPYRPDRNGLYVRTEADDVYV